MNPFKKETEEIIRNYKNKKAVIYYEGANPKELTYEDIHKISLTLQSFMGFAKNSCIGLLMDHNPFIPSIILCLQNLNCCFMFLKIEGDLSYPKVIISLNHESNISNYILKDTVDLLWEHKLYIYESDKEFYPKPNINYIIRTSGTTGVAKTVQVEHYCIYSNICSLRSKLNVTSQDVIYFSTTLTFDPSMVELYLGLTTGAALLMVSRKIKENLFQLHKILFKTSNVTFLQMCPSIFLRWNEEEIDFILNNSKLRVLLLGGEVFPKCLENLNTKTRIFNVYGITEVSCWASIDEIKCEKGVSLGEALDDTIFEVRDESGLRISNGEGELHIGSSKRICHIDNEISKTFRNTGDLVRVENNEIFYKSRVNDVFKRYGIRIDLIQIENQIYELVQLKNKLVYLEEKQKLILFIKMGGMNESTVSRFCDKLRIKLLHSLNGESFPDHIEVLSDFPLNENGKIDRDKLKSFGRNLFENQKDYRLINEVEVFKTIWTKYFINNFPDKTFYDLGGTSILRLQFCQEFKELIKNNELPTQFFDYLFMNPYRDVISFIRNYKFKRKLLNVNIEGNKRLKITDASVEMKIKWSYDLKACVDTTAFIIKNKKLVAIGGFSNILSILNIENGMEISRTILPNAIENSCSSTSCGEDIFVGCYDGCMYCIGTETGNINWSYKTGDKIKNKPVFIKEEKAIVFGSYDKYLYCLEIETGDLLWRKFLYSAITTDPLYLKEQKVIFICNLSGMCFLINISGEVLWNVKVKSPIFSSPSLFKGEDIIFAEVQGIIYSLNRNGNITWKYEINNYIYSSIKTFRNLIFFTSHDGFMYCLEVISEVVRLKFKIELDSASSSSVEVIDMKYLVTASRDGCVYLIDLNLASIVNKFKFDSEIFSSPVAYCNNGDVLIFVGCRDNNLHCIELK